MEAIDKAMHRKPGTEADFDLRFIIESHYCRFAYLHESSSAQRRSSRFHTDMCAASEPGSVGIVFGKAKNGKDDTFRVEEVVSSGPAALTGQVRQCLRLI